MRVSGQQANTIALLPADTTLSVNAGNSSTDPALTVYTWPDYMAGSSILLKFDLSSLPRSAVITSATLNLTLQQSDAQTASGYAVSAHEVEYGNPVIERATGATTDGATPWTASACCYHGVPLAQGDIGPAEDTQTLDATPGLKSWTVTAMARDWAADPARNYGVLLNPDVAAHRDSFRTFASAESPDPRSHPYLLVTFTAPDAQPPSVSLAGPEPGTTVSQTLPLTATASDASGVSAVQFYMNGTPIGTVQQGAPYRINWNTAAVSDGVYTITAAALDGAGNVGTSQALAVTVQNGTIILKPEDTSLNINTTNYGKSSTLTTYTWPDKKVANAILLKFDLSSIPAGSVITNATLHMAQVDSDAVADTYTVGAYKLLGGNPDLTKATGYTSNGATPWTASSCCANGASLAQSDISSAEDRQTLDRANGFRSWTMTHMTQDWLDRPSTNVGMLLNSDPSKPKDRYRYFASMEHSDSTLRPYLSITYTPPSGDTTPPVISGVSASSSTSSTAAVAWTTNEASDTQVDYGLTTSYSQKTVTQASLVTAHVAVLKGLQPATTYHVRARSRDKAGNLATSGDMSFITRTAAVGDVTPPTVSVTTPGLAATVSGTVTVSATAADAVGVAGVQFLVDGAAAGAEDTSAPYAFTWNTTKIANGLHELTASARDAAGNRATSEAVTVTVSNSAASTPEIFQSNWDTASGTSANAVSDGGRWPSYWEFNRGTNVQLLSVVPGGVNGHNALRVLQRGSTYAANLQIDNVVGQSHDYYLRYYMRNDDTSSAGDHTVTGDTYQYPNLTFMRKYGSPTGWTFVSSFYGCGYTYPIGHWGPAQKMTNGQWYRFEYFVHFVDSTHIEVHPRVYDSSGTLIMSDADFQQSDIGSSSWNGRSDWTLASYYAAGQSFCVQPEWVNDLGLGNNGQQGADDTGLAWYFSAVEIRPDRWPGPVAP